MKTKLSFVLCWTVLFQVQSFCQQIIWSETFDVFEKGYWGNGSGVVAGDMSGITKWTLNVSSCNLSSTSTYIKTVSTSGGRLQASAINGEAIWMSEIIDISDKKNINISISASETGSSSNSNKYVKFYYSLDQGAETLFELNGSNVGNFNSVVASQSKLNGNTLKIIARINNPVSDNCIVDNVVVSYDGIKPTVLYVSAMNDKSVKLKFSEPVKNSEAGDLSNYRISESESPISALVESDNQTVLLTFQYGFQIFKTYSLQISGISDLNDNQIEPVSFDFVYKSFALKKVYVNDSNKILLTFSYPLEKASAEDENHYFADNEIGKPLSAELITDSTVSLAFSVSFKNNMVNQIHIENISNMYGLLLENQSKQFVYHESDAFDLVINELMVDINPAPNILPEGKYIEIFNRSAYTVYTSGWSIKIGSNNTISLPDLCLEPKSYLILCASGQTQNFSMYGNVIGILPESQLTSSGKAISLFDRLGNQIDYVKYDESWYGDTEKSKGGWSIERIDPDNFCGESQNWMVSTDYKGGSPGSINSINKSNPDNSKPTLKKVQILSSDKLLLHFSKNISLHTGLDLSNYQLDDNSNLPKKISFTDSTRSTLIIQFSNHFTDSQNSTIQIRNLQDFCGNCIEPVSESFTYYLIHLKGVFAESDKILRLIFSEEVENTDAQITSNYLVNNDINNPSKAIKHTSRKNEIYLEFTDKFLSGQAYSIHIESIKDNDGNSMKPADFSFVYFSPEPNDLIINEILFNPRPAGVDFVEIYNRSGNPVDLSKLNIASKNENGDIVSLNPLSETNIFLQPYHFLAITTDTAKVKSEYPAINYDTFIQVPDMPSFNDDEGTVLIISGETIIDEFAYKEDMHFGLISNPEGISLERIDPDKTTQLRSNWQSAAESYGYASPANPNSQFKKLSENSNEVKIEPEVFSPDNDGYDDMTYIRYKYTESGYIANVYVFDSKGRMIKRLALNELLATEGEFRWDGLYENGFKAPIGIYIVYFEAFNLQGIVKKYKKVCVVADKM